MSNIAILNDTNFDEMIKSGVVLVDFFAEWCGPCRAIAPVLEEVAKELSGKVQFGKLDIEKSHLIAKTHNVTSVPTLILYKDGKEVDRLVGLCDAVTIKDFVTPVE